MPRWRASPAWTRYAPPCGTRNSNSATCEVESSQPEGLVLSQSPDAFTTVDVGTKVSIEVSTGVVEVPSVVGFTQSAATSALSNAGLDVSVVTRSIRPTGRHSHRETRLVGPR